MSEIIILQFLQYTQQSCQLGFEGSYLIIMTKETAISFETRGFWKILWNEVMDMECRKYDLLTLGEMLLRLSPPANERMILGVWQEMNSRTVSGRNVYFCQMLSYLRNYIGTG